jgi:hypothetical protein
MDTRGLNMSIFNQTINNRKQRLEKEIKEAMQLRDIYASYVHGAFILSSECLQYRRLKEQQAERIETLQKEYYELI